MDDRAKKATRKTIVENVLVCIEPRQKQEMPPRWHVLIILRSGTAQSTLISSIFYREDEANKLAREIHIGSEFKGLIEDSAGYSALKEEKSRRTIDDGYLLEIVEPCSWLPFLVLEGVGITRLRDGASLFESYPTDSSPTDAVLNLIGDVRILEIKEKFGNSWGYAAEAEYSFSLFPRSSPAYIAAAYNYARFILRDDLTAGYLLRDLEIAVHGIEMEAQKVAEARKRAGEKGMAASSGARDRRRMSLLAGMEALAKRNPDMVAHGDQNLAKYALRHCVNDDPKLWAQGGKQLVEYLDEIRRGEAGDEAKARYLALFPSKAA